MWETRKGLIQESIERLAPMDLCLLQEVDHFADFYQPMLSSLGLESCYLQRPGRKDGLLVGYRADKLTLETNEAVYFDDLALTTREGRPPKRDPVFERQNVGMICRFRCIDDPTREFLASNCHLYWNPARAEVKLAQARYLLQRIKRSNEGKDLPVVMGGDFNALPNSDVYQIITDSADGGTNFSHGGENHKETKFLVDFNLSKLARWMRVLGIDCVLESKESNQLRTGKQGDFSLLFAQARSEKRVILTSSRSMRERASCPQSMLVKTVQLEQELTRICSEFEIDISEKKFLTMCGKCGGAIESVQIDDPRLAGKFVPLDRPVFCCSSCLQVMAPLQTKLPLFSPIRPPTLFLHYAQNKIPPFHLQSDRTPLPKPYWWNERENSSPARAMRVAERLLKVVRGDDSWRGEGSKLLGGEGEGGSSGGGEGTKAVGEEADGGGGDGGGGRGSLADRFAQRSVTVAEREGKKLSRVEPEQMVAPIAPLRGGLSSALLMHCGKEPPHTNWNGDFRGTLDYIFVSSSKGIRVVDAAVEPAVVDSSLAPASTQGEPAPVGAMVVDLKEHGPLPNCAWPSDHMAVVATLTLE